MTDPVTISHEGYLEILVTALGVLATVFSILIAVLGFVGYASVKQSAREAAESAAKKQAEEIVKAEVAAYVDDRIKDAVTTALNAARERAHSDEQASELSLGQVGDRRVGRYQDMDNIVIRPKKRVVTDRDFGEDAS